MIRQLIIPGMLAAAGHAALFFAPADKTEIKAQAAPPLTEVVILPELPKVPIIPDFQQEDRPEVDIANIKLPPILPDTVVAALDNPFTTPYQPTIASPKIDGRMLTIPTGDYDNVAQGIRSAKPLFNLKELDNVPRTLHQAAPAYPSTMKSIGIGGEVVVTFTVDERGVVQDVRVISATHPDFEAPTIRAVSKWRFEAGRVNGKRVSFKMSVPVSFNINDAE